MKTGFSKISLNAKGAVVAFVLPDLKLAGAAKAMDDLAGGALSRAIAASRFAGNASETLEILAPANLAASRILLIGLGKAADLDDLAAERAGGAAMASLITSGEKTLTALVDPVKGAGISNAAFAAHFATGANLRSYRFDRYFTKQPAHKKPSVERILVMLADFAAARKLFAPLEQVANAVFSTRDLVSEPGNVIYPKSYAAEIKKLQKLGLKVEILGEKEMRKLGMGALLGVGQGSAHESQLVVMQWKGAPKSSAKGAREKPIAFVGKGVTFDSGGISIKPAGGMEDMKYDMGGSAAVVGLMKALASRKAKVNAVGVVGLVENMPSGTAQRPGDVVTSMSGQTIEVINTDAEGRLVLADALWYTQNRFQPRFMIDLATLTGAIIISLGREMAGIFSNDDTLAARLSEVSAKVGEKVWRMPLGDAYDKDIDSAIADMKNVGEAPSAGSISAAQFLQRFVNKTPWVHIDIAGTAWAKKDQPLCARGATGYGVRLLDRLVADYYEAK
jgi:leucyl aminopeptidase